MMPCFSHMNSPTSPPQSHILPGTWTILRASICNKTLTQAPLTYRHKSIYCWAEWLDKKEQCLRAGCQGHSLIQQSP